MYLNEAAGSLRRALRTWTARTAGAAVAVAVVAGATAPAAEATPAPASRSVATVSSSEISAYVTAVYLDLFSRKPDSAGLSTWTSRLASGTPRVAVANSITSSAEYRSKLIAGVYHEYLGRTPDGAGLSYWLTQMNGGFTIQQLEGGFVASDEYYARSGGTPARWVSTLYSDVLGRAAGSSEVRYWTGRLATGMSRGGVAAGFLLSTEHLTTVVDAQYRTLLGRSIDPAGAASWVSAIQHGTRIETVVGGIVASDEYAKANGWTSPTAAAAPQPTPPPAASTGAFPSASTTGVPAGVSLTPYTGPSTITAAGTVIDGKLITQPLVIASSASNVTIRNSKISAQGFWLVLNDAGAKNLQIIDTELDGKNNATGDAAVAGRNYTLTRVNVHGTVDGLKLGDNVTVQDSYIHDLVMTSDSHNDGMQSLGASNVQIRHNTIIIGKGSTSAILLSTGSGAQRDFTIDSNLVGGGAYTIYGGYQPGVDSLSQVSNIVITNNHVTTQIYPNGGAYGPFTSVGSAAVTMRGNVWQDGSKAGQTIS